MIRNPTHTKGCHPETKKHFDFSNDRFAWYWIYLTHNKRVVRIFNTYEWYIYKRLKDCFLWKNYYDDEKENSIIKTKFKQIKKVIYFKTEKYNNYQWELLESEVEVDE